MSNIDVKRYSLPELIDAADHVDRKRWPERAAELDAEIRDRRAAGEQLPWSTRGGAGWGETVWDWSVSYPSAKLAFTDRYIALSVPTLAVSGQFRLERSEVSSIWEWRGLFFRGFQIVHENADVPPALFFRLWRLNETHLALVARGWVLGPGKPDPAHLL